MVLLLCLALPLKNKEVHRPLHLTIGQQHRLVGRCENLKQAFEVLSTLRQRCRVDFLLL
jgi:hypothetical protein